MIAVHHCIACIIDLQSFHVIILFTLAQHSGICPKPWVCASSELGRNNELWIMKCLPRNARLQMRWGLFGSMWNVVWDVCSIRCGPAPEAFEWEQFCWTCPFKTGGGQTLYLYWFWWNVPISPSYRYSTKSEEGCYWYRVMIQSLCPAWDTAYMPGGARTVVGTGGELPGGQRALQKGHFCPNRQFRHCCQYLF